MCDRAIWTKADHRTLHNALDAYADEVREATQKLLEVSGMVHMDIAIDASRHAETLRKERKQLRGIRKDALRLKDQIQGLQGDLRFGADEARDLHGEPTKAVMGCPEDTRED